MLRYVIVLTAVGAPFFAAHEVHWVIFSTVCGGYLQGRNEGWLRRTRSDVTQARVTGSIWFAQAIHVLGTSCFRRDQGIYKAVVWWMTIQH